MKMVYWYKIDGKQQEMKDDTPGMWVSAKYADELMNVADNGFTRGNVVHDQNEMKV